MSYIKQRLVRQSGDRHTAEMVDNLALVATYQPLWGCKPLKYKTYSEEMEALILKHSKKCLIVGGEFNATVGEKWDLDDAAGPYGLNRTNAAGRSLVERSHARNLACENSFSCHDNGGAWKCPNRKTRHELDGFLL